MSSASEGEEDDDKEEYDGAVSALFEGGKILEVGREVKARWKPQQLYTQISANNKNKGISIVKRGGL